MNIEQASNLGTVDDVLNMVQVFGILSYFILPFLLALFIIYFIRKRNNARNNKDTNKKDTNKKDTNKKDIDKKDIDKKDIDKKDRDKKDRDKKTDIQNNIKRKEKEKRIKANKIFKDTESMIKKLDNIEEPLIKSDYSSLTINFDKKGKMIKENKHGNCN